MQRRFWYCTAFLLSIVQHTCRAPRGSARPMPSPGSHPQGRILYPPAPPANGCPRVTPGPGIPGPYRVADDERRVMARLRAEQSPAPTALFRETVGHRHLTWPPVPGSPPTQHIYYLLFLIYYLFSKFPKHFAKFHCISQNFRVQLDTTLSGYLTSNYNKEVL